jgi:hypothetical protein
MDRIREWQNLKYHDPKKILLGLRNIEQNYPLHEYPYKVASLRTKDLREYGESRQCALFCYGISEVFGLEVQYTQIEKSDYDFVAIFPRGEYLNYVPIQMKEFVPVELNPNVELEQELCKLEKYSDSNDLCVAIHVNRNTRIEFNKLKIPKLNIKELWFFGAKSQTQKEWWLMGNMLRDWRAYEFRYPN